MYEEKPIISYEYEGALSKLCEGLVAEKRALGYQYNTEAKNLREFDTFTLDFEFTPNTLPEKIVRAWIARRPMETDRAQYARLALMKLLAEYMIRLGHSAYCPQKEELGRIQWSYVPYIFTYAELTRFFAAVDNLKKNEYTCAPRRHIVMPLLFRMLYCCGLRSGEATLLRTKDVDLESGILTIQDSKFGKTRYVPMAQELTSLCREYVKTAPLTRDGYFFPAPDDGFYHTRSIYCVFRDLLWDAGISHGGRGKGPRVHDFRHTFAVHCLSKWVRSGKDLSTALPRLSAYLGHNDLQATERYLRMTSDVYPEISCLLEDKYGYIIPKRVVE